MAGATTGGGVCHLCSPTVVCAGDCVCCDDELVICISPVDLRPVRLSGVECGSLVVAGATAAHPRPVVGIVCKLVGSASPRLDVKECRKAAGVSKLCRGMCVETVP